MKTIKKIFLLVIFPFIGPFLLHLLISYGAWEINPANWNERMRGIMTYPMFVVLVLNIIFALDLYKKIK